MSPSPLDTRNLSDQIYAYLREEILSGAFRPGDRLSETSVAERLGVSRAPVREALRQLANDGLADQRARKGVYVPSFDADTFHHLTELREGLETMAARLAALRATEAEVAELNELISQTKDVIESEDGGQYPAHLDLHRHVARLAKNPVLSEQIRAAHTRLQLARLLSGRSEDRAARAYAEHVEIVRAIEARDPDRAEAAMRNHLQRAVDHSGRVLPDSSDEVQS
jgi:DNA-binding GntR family transcriptional regulator